MELFENGRALNARPINGGAVNSPEKTKNPALGPERIRPLSAGNFASVLDGGDADCLGTLGALGDLELNALVLVE
jgi:hypothetical protein